MRPKAFPPKPQPKRFYRNNYLTVQKIIVTQLHIWKSFFGLFLQKRATILGRSFCALFERVTFIHQMRAFGEWLLSSPSYPFKNFNNFSWLYYLAQETILKF